MYGTYGTGQGAERELTYDVVLDSYNSHAIVATYARTPDKKLLNKSSTRAMGRPTKSIQI